MTSNNNTLKSGTPTKQKTLTGIRKERQQAIAREKAKEKADGAKVRKKYKNKKNKNNTGGTPYDIQVQKIR